MTQAETLGQTHRYTSTFNVKSKQGQREAHTRVKA